MSAALSGQPWHCQHRDHRRDRRHEQLRCWRAGSAFHWTAASPLAVALWRVVEQTNRHPRHYYQSPAWRGFGSAPSSAAEAVDVVPATRAEVGLGLGRKTGGGTGGKERTLGIRLGTGGGPHRAKPSLHWMPCVLRCSSTCARAIATSRLIDPLNGTGGQGGGGPGGRGGWLWRAAWS